MSDQTMRAMVLEQHGGPLTLRSLAVPDPGAGDVLLRVRACAVDRFDLAIRAGGRERASLPHVLGHEIAGEIAAAIAAERLIFLTDVDGIHDEQDSLIPHLSPADAEKLLSSGVASGGMVPKLRACLRALSSAQTASIIGGETPHALLRVIEGDRVGTTIRKD